MDLYKARRDYTDKLGRTWKWNGTKYVYQRKGTSAVRTKSDKTTASRGVSLAQRIRDAKTDVLLSERMLMHARSVPHADMEHYEKRLRETQAHLKALQTGMHISQEDHKGRRALWDEEKDKASHETAWHKKQRTARAKRDTEFGDFRAQMRAREKLVAEVLKKPVATLAEFNRKILSKLRPGWQMMRAREGYFYAVKEGKGGGVTSGEYVYRYSDLQPKEWYDRISQLIDREEEHYQSSEVRKELMPHGGDVSQPAKIAKKVVLPPSVVQKVYKPNPAFRGGKKFTAGDRVAAKNWKERHGFVQWVDDRQGLVSVRFPGEAPGKPNSYIVVPQNTVVKVVGEKGISTLFPPKR
jgi:hypothetical protein